MEARPLLENYTFLGRSVHFHHKCKAWKSEVGKGGGALGGLLRDVEVRIAFKGFHEDIDSFGSFQYDEDSAEAGLWENQVPKWGRHTRSTKTPQPRTKEIDQNQDRRDWGGVF